MNWGGMFRPGMRAYFIPLVAGLVLAASAFLPWVVVDGVRLPGCPTYWALWAVGLGAIAAVLALLSLITARIPAIRCSSSGSSRSASCFCPGASCRALPASARYTIAQAFAIVENRPLVRRAVRPPSASASTSGSRRQPRWCGFGLTIVVKRVAQPYVITSPDDDV